MTKEQKKIELIAQKRKVVGHKVKHLRKEGFVPAVLYGKGMDSISLQVPLKDFSRTFKSAGESTLVYLSVDGQMYPTIIHGVARDPVSEKFTHADFYKVNLDEKIKTKIPVVFSGESPAVKDLGAIFVRNVNEVEVEALPQDLPHDISIDLSRLTNFGDQILLGDIDFGDKVKVLGRAEEIIATVQEPISEEELKASLEAPTTDVSAVEEIKKEERAEEVVEEETIPVSSEVKKGE